MSTRRRVEAVSTDEHPAIPSSLTENVARLLGEDRRVWQPLPGGGTVSLDRRLPFLCVYRRNPTRIDRGTELFVTAEASYLLAPGDAPVRKGLKRLVHRIAETASLHQGAFLILEIWSADDRHVPRAVDDVTGEPLLPRPHFRVLTRQLQRLGGTAAALEFGLQRIKVNRQAAKVEIEMRQRNHSPGMTQLISAADAERLNCHVIGLEVVPIYRDGKSGRVYDGTLRILRRGITRALKKTFFSYALEHTRVRPQHYFSLGRRSLPQQVVSVDARLADVSGAFKFLLLVTPLNAERSWHGFAASRYVSVPAFQYRPLDGDPLLLKRRLACIPTERIDDPTLAHVLRQTQDELDRQVTMLSDIGTRRFLPGSLQVFGSVEPELADLATEILRRLPATDNESSELVESVDARTFARHATREIKYYRRQLPAFAARAIVRDDMYSGLLATGGNLLIGREFRTVARRVDALLQHEVGTHLVTYYNGQAQPLRLLKVGLAGFDGLQEGLAVLSEYLVGGLSRDRMRTLAARVVAVRHMVLGAPMTEAFRRLVEEHGFKPRTAYTITLRVYRGGGFTKDAVYLRGLVEVLHYLGKGGDLEPLFVGKIAIDQIPVVRELLARGVLRRPTVLPRFLGHDRAVERLRKLARGCEVLDLLDPSQD